VASGSRRAAPALSNDASPVVTGENHLAFAWSDPVEAWLRCVPVSARHTIVAGKQIVANGELQLRSVDEMLKRHDEISREWQGASV
jgi:hypothetical protein